MLKVKSFVFALFLSSTTFAADPGATDLSWLAGRWCSADGSGGYEESWLQPRGGGMVGVARELKGERMVSFEFLRIGEVDGTPTYFAQPGGRAPTAFKRSDGGEHWVRFENPANDFPQRIEYRREGDLLNAEISGPGRDGKPQSIPFALKRCD